jgi:hypothetical protein
MRFACACVIAVCLALGGCDNGAKQREEISKALDEENKRLDARLLELAVERIEIVHGHLARLQAELDLMKGGSIYQIEKAPCQSLVFVDGHPAGKVTGCDTHTRYGQTTVDDPYCIFSLPPKNDGDAYSITVKKAGYKDFQLSVKPQEKHGYVRIEAPMQKS